jgi:hypothetical protein
MAHDDLSRLLEASVELETLRRNQQHYEDKAQHVFDTLVEMLLARCPSLARDMILYADWIGLDSAHLRGLHPAAARRADDQLREHVVGG